jgi:nitrate reductase delta subunit
MDRVAVYESLAALLRYPDERYQERVGVCRELLSPAAPEMAAKLEQLAADLRGLSIEQAQELFTQTFDLNPLCSLEFGWHLFGENYERGALLARLRRELAAHGVPENGELPDHLTHALPLLARMEVLKADDFYAACLFPALEKMTEAFRGKETPFAAVIAVSRDLLRAEHGALLAAAAQPAANLPVLQEAAHE